MSQDRFFASVDGSASLHLRPAIGLASPRWWYHLGQAVHAAPALGILHRQATLQLGNDLTGAGELAELRWDREQPHARQRAVLAELLDMALAAARAAPAEFGGRLIVELQGQRDADGRSPFWEGLGRHFYVGDPAEAQRQHGPGWRDLVAALLPRHRVYTSFLPEDAQRAIAAIDPVQQPWCEVLRAAGARPADQVDLHDGGPVWVIDLG
jgi:arginine N-succinyltransferase